jgi:chromate transporter
MSSQELIHENNLDAAIPQATPDQQPPTTAQLFMGFLWLGMIGFGGVVPLARRMIVEKNKWLTGAEFTELLGLCQFLPGGNIINLSVAIGLHFRGLPGAFASIIGLVAMPTIVVVCLGMVYDRFQSDPHVQHMFLGLAAAAAGLLISMAVKVAWPLRKDAIGLIIATLCFVAIAVLRLPLLPTMVVLTAAGTLVAWRRQS